MCDEVDLLRAHAVSCQHQVDLFIRCECLADGQKKFLRHGLEAGRLSFCGFHGQEHDLQHCRWIGGGDATRAENMERGDQEGGKAYEVNVLKNVEKHLGG